ncbi:carbohydrate kinase family protein [Sphingobacterium faecale]|uniref:Carbohydrate kinase n=1 Tax=Sphingobacterium faecale TaxID=2803775 RepID=A0ABS1R388_9SPHI|nr:carbohydrate kinase [Sphingobacterium faecale]MBL1408745.1 carbohydrate kinase [Sphingobacterium faecale]
MNTKVYCFGEVLWDIIGGTEIPGGAPMNVAYHLAKLSVSSYIISCVGRDKRGEKLMGFLNENDVDTSFVIDSIYPTGIVNATIDANEEVNYDIVYPSAWDNIKVSKDLSRMDILVFGSLASRSDRSYEALKSILSKADLKIFDVNLRPPFLDKDKICYLLGLSDVVKVNLSELNTIYSWFESELSSDVNQATLIMDKFSISELILTKGAEGGCYFSDGVNYNFKAYPVSVKDTIGSGDSFLAGFIYGRLNGFDLEENLEFATQISGYITSNKGGCPEYQLVDFNRFLWKKSYDYIEKRRYVAAY